MAKAFKNLTEEEIQDLSPARKEKYDAWLAEQEDGGDGSEGLSQEEAGAVYFEENPNCPVDAILVCEDGTVFYSTTVGKNAAENHGSPFIEVTKD